MSFQHPYILLLLIIPPILLVLAIILASRRSGIWSSFVASRLRPSLIRRSSPLPRWISLACLMLSLVFMILGLARFQVLSASEIETTKGRNVIVVLDLSRSMATNDLKPSRLAQAKILIYELLETLPNDRVGLVGFAGIPYLFAPLTHDHSAVRETIEQLDFDSIPRGGSDLGAAVELAVTTLKETAQTNNGLIIISDGEEHEAALLKTLPDIAKSNTYTFTIGIGTEDGGFIQDPTQDDGKFRDVNGNIVVSRLQTKVLKDFASQSGGRFAIANSVANIPDMVAAAVADLDTFERKGGKKVLAKELFSWFVLPAMLLLFTSIIIGTRWRSLGSVASPATIALIAIFSIATTPSSHADESPSLYQARSAFAAGDYEKSANIFGQLAAKEVPGSSAHAGMTLGKASSHYQRQEYSKAREAYSQALQVSNSSLRANAHQGMGNTLFQLGWQTLSDGKSYPNEKEGMEAFDKNLQERIGEWLSDTESSPDAPSEGFRKLESIMLNWSDAIRHTQSADALDPAAKANHNGEIAKTYLKKLRQKMEEMQQEMRSQMSGQGECDQPGEGEGDQKGEGQGESDQEGEGQNGDKEKDGNGKDGDKEKDGSGKEGPEKPDPNNKHGKDRKGGETKEEHALRKLKETSDLQRGVTAPGTHRDPRRPEKDW